jgi:hypothetical protein
MIEICGESIAFDAELQTDTQYPRYARLESPRPVEGGACKKSSVLALPSHQDVPNIILTRARQNIGVPAKYCLTAEYISD